MSKMLPSRKNMRLESYDYSSSGYYFITICTSNHKNTLAKIRRGDPCGRPNIYLSELGKICENTVATIKTMYNISVLNYVIMPNHIHLIISIDSNCERTTARVAPTIGLIIGSYKSIISHFWLAKCKEYNIHMGQIWQRGYHDHIIRNNSDYRRIWQYIDENPLKWTEDCYYTD